MKGGQKKKGESCEETDKLRIAIANCMSVVPVGKFSRDFAHLENDAFGASTATSRGLDLQGDLGRLIKALANTAILDSRTFCVQ